jgi:hypothetical protein
LAAGSYTPHDPYSTPSKGMQPRTKRLLLIGAAALVFLALVVAVPVGVTQSRKSSSKTLAAAAQDPNQSQSPNSQAGTATAAVAAPSATPSNVAISGRTGSLVKLSNGSDVTYTNTFGGDWVWDETDPFGKKDGALGGGRAQEWSPRSGEDWKWGVDQVRGVSTLSPSHLYLSRPSSSEADRPLLRLCRSTSVRLKLTAEPLRLRS